MRSLFILLVMSLFTAWTPAWADGPSMTQGRLPQQEQVYPLPEFGEDWQSVESIYARLHFESGHEGTARMLLEHAEAAVPRIAEELSLPTGGVIDIVLSPNTEHFQNIQPGTPPKWADATAWPRSGLIFLRAPAARANSVRPLTQVLDHEIVHVVLGRAFAPNPVPRWLQEGTAQLLALEYTPEVTEQLASGLLGDTLLELGDLTTGFPSGPSKARLAYAQSADFMAHIRAEYGEEAFQNLIQHLVDGKPTDAAIRLALGKSMTDVDKEWRSRLESGPLWLQAVVNDTTLLAVTGLLFAVGYWRFRGRKRAVLDEWEREENERDALYAQMNQQWERNQYWVIDGDFTEHEWSATDSESTTGSQWQPKNPL